MIGNLEGSMSLRDFSTQHITNDLKNDWRRVICLLDRSVFKKSEKKSMLNVFFSNTKSK